MFDTSSAVPGTSTPNEPCGDFGVTCRGAAAADQLCRVLDSLHASKKRLEDRFQLESAEHRSIGTHGVVQTAFVPERMVCRFYCLILANAIVLAVSHCVCVCIKDCSSSFCVFVQGRVAIKFFTDLKAFSMEKHIASLDVLKPFLVAPTIIANSNGTVKTSQGYVFPPHTVIEAGESLEKWMSGSNDSDFITCVQVGSELFLYEMQTTECMCMQ